VRVEVCAGLVHSPIDFDDHAALSNLTPHWRRLVAQWIATPRWNRASCSWSTDWGYANAFYASGKARGLQHQAALRALTFKWIRIRYRCWVDRVPHDEARYLLALQKRQAPLLKIAADLPR
jgi:hypothetical protein